MLSMTHTMRKVVEQNDFLRVENNELSGWGNIRVYLIELNECLLAKFGFDAPENEPSKVCRTWPV